MAGPGAQHMPQILTRATTSLLPALLLAEFIHTEFTSSLCLSYGLMYRLWEGLRLWYVFKFWRIVYEIRHTLPTSVPGTRLLSQ